MRTSVTIDDTVAFLNKLAELDNPFMRILCLTRVECNENVASRWHTHVHEDEKGVPHIGLLGFLNGLFQVGGAQWGTICAKIEKDTGRVSFFKKEDA